MRNKLLVAGVLFFLATYFSSCIIAEPGYGYGGHWGGYYHGGGGGGCHRGGGYHHYR